LLLARLSLAGIVRVTGVSKRWLPYYINDKYHHISKLIAVKNKAKVV
jgi:insertion element IS1 protein InsB